MDTTVQPKIPGKPIEDPVGPSETVEKEHNIIISEETSCDIPNQVTAARSDDPRREGLPRSQVSTRASQDDAVASDGHRIQLEKAPQDPEVLKLPPVPDSCIQFQADWKSLRRNRNVLSQYFKVCVNYRQHTVCVLLHVYTNCILYP